MSSNITPIRQQAMPDQQDWWWTQPPPGTWPPQQGCPPPQPCPPQPVPPSCFSQVAKANACWDQSQALYNLVSKVVMDIFQTNPGIIPPPPPATGSGPRLGVTDGSLAKPGEIGEFVHFETNFPYGTAFTSQVISAGVLQPGDWSCSASMAFTSFINGATFALSPQPPSFSTGMTGVLGVLDSSTLASSEDVYIIGQIGRASFSVPTLLAFAINIWPTSSGPQPGTAFLDVQCTRVR